MRALRPGELLSPEVCLLGAICSALPGHFGLGLQEDTVRVAAKLGVTKERKNGGQD